MSELTNDAQLLAVIPKNCTTALLVSLLATCTSPSYAIVTHYQSLNNDSFILVDMVAVSGNNAPQELRKLFTTVQHRTIADVFLCPSFFGVVSHSHAITPLWWGGRANKPFTRRIPRAVVVTVFEPPYRPTFRANIKTSLPFEKVLQQ